MAATTGGHHDQSRCVRALTKMIDPTADRFLRACGGIGPLRLDVEGEEASGATSCTFHQPFILIGRDPRADLSLDDPQVSRRHAYLQLIAGRLFWADLGSRTGTHPEGEPGRSGWLSRDAAVRVGPRLIRHRGGPEVPAGPDRPRSPLRTRIAGDDSSAGVTLEFLGRSSRRTAWRMNRVLALVGRSPACRVRLKTPDVSEFHCSLLSTPDGVWAIDLLGRDGVSVNGTRVRFARLDDGDELRVGRYRFLLRDTRPPGPPPPSDGPPTSPGRVQFLMPSASASASMAELVGWPRTPHDLACAGQLGQGEFAESILVPLLEQCHRSMMSMFQMFGAIHRDQMEALRGEFQEVQRLNRELMALHARSMDRPPSDQGDPPRGLPAPAPGVAPTGPAPGWDPKVPMAPAGRGAALPTAEGIRRSAPRSATRSDADAYAALYRRIAAIQEDRQGRWQKILGLVTGVNQGARPPGDPPSSEGEGQ